MMYDSGLNVRSEAGADSGERRRQRLVVHDRDGTVAYGFAVVMNRQAEGFHLEVVDKHNQPTGKSVYFQFKDVKAVFYVKSYDGRFDPEKYDHGMPSNGVPLVIIFEDGETIKGHALSSTWTREQRFFFVPEDSASNNLGMLVERTAAKQILSPDEHKRMLHAEVEAFVAAHGKPGMSREIGRASCRERV